MAGLVGVLYSVPLFLLLRNPPQAAEAERALSQTPSPLAAVRTLAGSRDFLLLVLYFTLPAIAGWVDRGLATDDDARVRLTRTGLLVSDALWADVLTG